MAGKIEQSYPIQPLIQEILLLFQQEAICIGPAFRNNVDNESERTGTKKSPNSIPNNGPKGKPNRTRGNSILGAANIPAPYGDNKPGNENPNKDGFQKNSWDDSGDKPVVEGFRISCSGRLQMSPRSKPAEKAESVVISRGVLPFNSLDQNIDFKQTYATNAYGTIGIKV
jgi:hypothetical protein